MYPRVTLTHSTAAVAATTTQVAAANANRAYLLIQNIAATEAIYLAFGGNAVAAAGIKLDAGGSIEMGLRFGNLDTRVVNAIHAGTGTHNLLVSEG